MKKMASNNVLTCYTVPFSEPCQLCGEAGEYYMKISTFWWTKGVVLCKECRLDWLNDEVMV